MSTGLLIANIVGGVILIIWVINGIRDLRNVAVEVRDKKEVMQSADAVKSSTEDRPT